jgi:phage baseplate assembly protein gpV
MGTTTFDYDRAGRVVAIAGPSGTTGFTYDTAGRLVATTAPDGTRISFSYDAAGRLALVLPDPGDEVLVSFLEGDPDRPIVLGSIYTDGNSVTLTPQGRLLTCRDCP